MSPITVLFAILTLGYLLGRVTVKGLSLGSSGVIIVALVFGHRGYLLPADVQNLGLICFVTAVGFIAGPVFFRNFKAKAPAYILLGLAIVAAGAGVCAWAIRTFQLPAALAAGLMCGALTSTPGLAAALEASGDAVASVGYGIAYPFGVVGVVLFVQLIPRLVSADIKEELDFLRASPSSSQEAGGRKEPLLTVDPFGLMVFSLAVTGGIYLGQLPLPLPGGATFRLGLSGGPLLAGLLAGHLGRLGPISLAVPKETLNTLREFGLVLFLAGAGAAAGNGFVEVLRTYGISLFFIGMAMTLIPMVVGYLLAVRVFKLKPFTALGSICGGMTSTPALGSLIAVSGTDLIAAAYAATYPVALMAVVLASQIICHIF